MMILGDWSIAWAWLVASARYVINSPFGDTADFFCHHLVMLIACFTPYVGSRYTSDESSLALSYLKNAVVGVTEMTLNHQSDWVKLTIVAHEIHKCCSLSSNFCK